MKTETIVEQLERIARDLGIQVRRERGRFRGGHCLLEGEPIIVLNRLHPSDVHLAQLARSLSPERLENLYLRPAVRERLEQEWSRQMQNEPGHDLE